MAFIQTATKKGVDRNSVCPLVKATRTEEFKSWLDTNPDMGAEVCFKSLGVYSMALSSEFRLDLFPTTLKANLVIFGSKPRANETIVTCFDTLEGLVKVITKMHRQKHSGGFTEETLQTVLLD
jgi:hypothetical protein